MKIKFFTIICFIMLTSSISLANDACEKCEGWRTVYRDVCVMDYYKNEKPCNVNRTEYCNSYADEQVLQCKMRNCKPQLSQKEEINE
jgi:hypothetical protein